MKVHLRVTRDDDMFWDKQLDLVTPVSTDKLVGISGDYVELHCELSSLQDVKELQSSLDVIAGMLARTKHNDQH